MIDQQPPMPPARQDMPADRHAARRAALLTEMTARRRFPARRVAFGGLAAATLAGGVTAALIAVPDTGPGTGPAQIVPMSATQVLDRAAEAAAKAPEPRPGQYIYTETESRAGYLPRGLIRAKSWYAVNGKGIGLKIEGGERFWVCEAVAKPSPSRAPADCKNQPGYRRDLPVDAKAMRDWLYKTAPSVLPPDVRTYLYVFEIAAGAKLSPGAQAALFKATGTIAGVQVVQSTPGSIAVGQTWRGIRSELLFEPKTYRFIGTRTVADPDTSFQPKGGTVPPEMDKRKPFGADLKPGTVADSYMIVDQRVVDAIPAAYVKGAS
ncbi:CU044_5270 family protein [Actinomadura sp. 9N407]|uniref:CU044_5270 family protein n=1 Tax=Actinomadura sp. 9N407 TaxID=3375154 RepID=UPI0037995DA5